MKNFWKWLKSLFSKKKPGGYEISHTIGGNAL